MAEEIIDGQHATLAVDGAVVGGITQYRFAEGNPAVVAHRPLNGDSVRYLPGQPDWGTCSLTLYRDHTDAGQQVLAESRATRKVFSATLTLPDASFTFTAFCESMPIIGGKNPGSTVLTSVARLRIASPITAT